MHAHFWVVYIDGQEEYVRSMFGLLGCLKASLQWVCAFRRDRTSMLCTCMHTCNGRARTLQLHTPVLLWFGISS